MMEKADNLAGEFFSSTQEYIDLKTRSVKIEYYLKGTQMLTGATQTGILAVLGLFTLLLLTLGTVFWVSSLLHSLIGAFFVMAAVYLAAFTVYYFYRHRMGNRKMQNLMLQKISGSMNDYEALLAEKERLDAHVHTAGIRLKNNIESLRIRITDLQEQIRSLKARFSLNGEPGGSGGSFAKMAATSVIDILLNVVVPGKGGMIRRTLSPMISNAIVSSRLFRSGKKPGMLEGLKRRLGKFFIEKDRPSP